jgi:hypothetical protein
LYRFRTSSSAIARFDHGAPVDELVAEDAFRKGSTVPNPDANFQREEARNITPYAEASEGALKARAVFEHPRCAGTVRSQKRKLVIEEAPQFP